jgi:hypothetical protein
MRKKVVADHGKDSNPPLFVQSVKPGGSWNVIAMVSSRNGGDGLTGPRLYRHGLRHGRQFETVVYNGSIHIWKSLPLYSLSILY